MHRERQTHRIARSGVGVLANNEDLHPAHRAAERIENIGSRRESTVPRRVLLTQESTHSVNLLFDGGECCRPILAHNAAEGLVHKSPREYPRADAAPAVTVPGALRLLLF